MKVTLKPYEKVKVAKIENPCDVCHYIYFKLWQKNDKSRVYINDYKGRTIGYIDTVSEETIIEDKQGSREAEIEYAIKRFMADYVVKETAETTPEQSETKTLKKTTSTRKKVMQRAWEIARQGVAQFGGKVKEYFAEALKMAWAEIKAESSIAKKIENLIKEYNLKVVGENGENIGVNKSIQKHPEDIDFVKSHKSEIIDFIKKAEEAKKRTYEDYCKKVNGIEGLKEIRDAINSTAVWRRKLARSFEGEYAVGGYGVGKPKYDNDSLNALYAKYPRAVAFIKAEDFSNASHWFKSRVGKTAMAKIANGEDYTAVISNMEAEWHKHCEANVD